MSHAVAGQTDDRTPAPEFRGLARAARARFLAAAIETGAQMRRIVDDAQAGYKGKSTNVSLRLIQSIRWKKISLDGCLAQSIVLDGRKLDLSDTRITASLATQPEWAGNELGVCIIKNNLRARKAGMYWDAPLVVGMSLHCLARWHQRSLRPTPEALIADLRLLAEQTDIIATREPRFSVATNGGFFVGHIVQTAEQPPHLHLDTRSFVWEVWS